MGARKRISAEKIKEKNANKVCAKLRNYRTSPRKMRLLADLIRSQNVNQALDVLKYSKKHASKSLETLLLSAISNWQNKNKGQRLEDANLIVNEIFVDQSKTLKRIQPAPQGRAHRIKKRSCHVSIFIEDMNKINEETEEELEEEEIEGIEENEEIINQEQENK